MEDLAVAARRQDRLMAVVESDDEKRILIAPANLDDLADPFRCAHDAAVDPDSISRDGVHRPPPPRPG